MLNFTDSNTISATIIRLIIGAISGVMVIEFLSTDEQLLRLFGYELYYYFTAAGAVVALVIRSIDRYLNKTLLWQQNITLRLIVGYILHVVSMLIISILLFILAFYMNGLDNVNQIFSSSYFIKLSIIILLLMVVYEIIYFALYSYHEYATVQIETMESEKKQLQLQLEALKSQLRPHYLFNSLNTISSLLYKNAKQTEQFIRRLVNNYQYTLSTQDKQLVTIREELEFLKSYHFLLKVRFDDNIDLEVNVSEKFFEYKIPPLTLQLLLENAIKHNSISATHPLKVYVVSTDNQSISIINTRNHQPHQANSFNIGLENIAKRYDILAKEKIKVDNGKQFTVTIPILSTQGHL